MDQPLKLTMTLPMIPKVELLAIDGIQHLCKYKNIDADRVDEAKILVGEAVINALEHADSSRQETKVDFTITDEKIVISVRDYGRGFDADKVPVPKIEQKIGAKNKRGWGLQLMRSLSDDFTIDSGPDGTTITIYLNL
ncbi:MAG: ATP-binding protein [Bacteroidota bacterium]